MLSFDRLLPRNLHNPLHRFPYIFSDKIKKWLLIVFGFGQFPKHRNSSRGFLYRPSGLRSPIRFVVELKFINSRAVRPLPSIIGCMVISNAFATFSLWFWRKRFSLSFSSSRFWNSVFIIERFIKSTKILMTDDEIDF